MGSRFPFSGLPTGWYNVALSDELAPGQLITRRYFGKEIVIYRAASGEVRMADAFCPHMGAHLGRLGAVDGERLRCRFHGFEYDGNGRCVHTPYDGPPPQNARLGFWDISERNGLILAWYDADGAPPSWEVPALDDEGWNAIRWRRFEIPTHPQETTENSVDFGHFTQIHGFVDGSITRPITVEGPNLKTAYRAHRPMPSPRLPLWKVPVDYTVNVWGLGYSQVDVRIEPLRMSLRLFVLAVPRDDENVDYVLGSSTPKKLGPIAALTRHVGLTVLCKEVEQDLDVWTYKEYVEHPALAKGDGPVAVYRRYVKQFYADTADEYRSKIAASMPAPAANAS